MKFQSKIVLGEASETRNGTWIIDASDPLFLEKSLEGEKYNDQGFTDEIPASITRTLTCSSSLRRLAMTEPAVPAEGVH